MAKDYSGIDFPAFENKRIACLTLDLERDYGTAFEESSYEGLDHVPDFVAFFKDKDIPLTCFVQGSLFETHRSCLEMLSTIDVEFELHSFSHPRGKDANVKFEIEHGKQAYSDFFGKEPVGYRCPDGVIDKKGYEILAANGFRFDSSIFPSLRPGAFYNLRKPTRPYLLNNPKLVEFPFTVFSNIVRIPIALSYIQLLGKPYLYLLKTFPLPNLIIFGFHLHDLFELSSSREMYHEKHSFIYNKLFNRIYFGRKLNGLWLLDEFILLLQNKGYTFLKLMDVYEAAKGCS